jgi:hypothetical protein
LYLRGYVRVATIATRASPRGQRDVALIGWQGRPMFALETTLDWLVHFLASAAVLVIRIDTPERMTNRTLEAILERPGFHVEVGILCEHGLTISARRRSAPAMAVAA